MKESSLARIERFEINLIQPKPDHAMITTFPDGRLWDSNLKRFVTEQEIRAEHYEATFYLPFCTRDNPDEYGLSVDDVKEIERLYAEKADRIFGRA